jgi:hypothetical protein
MPTPKEVTLWLCSNCGAAKETEARIRTDKPACEKCSAAGSMYPDRRGMEEAAVQAGDTAAVTKALAQAREKEQHRAQEAERALASQQKAWADSDARLQDELRARLDGIRRDHFEEVAALKVKFGEERRDLNASLTRLRWLCVLLALAMLAVLLWGR